MEGGVVGGPSPLRLHGVGDELLPLEQQRWFTSPSCRQTVDPRLFVMRRRQRNRDDGHRKWPLQSERKAAGWYRRSERPGERFPLNELLNSPEANSASQMLLA